MELQLIRNAGMLAFECSHEIVQQRVRAYTSYYSVCSEDLQYDLYIRSNEGLFLTLPEGEEVLQDYIQRHGLRLLVIDTLSKVINGDENSTKDMNELSKCLSRIAANTQSAIVIVHHEAKASAGKKRGISRGSGALLADVRSEIRVHDTNNQKTLEHTKSNNSEKRKAVKYDLVNKELGLDKHGRRIKAGVFVPEVTLEEQIKNFNSKISFDDKLIALLKVNTNCRMDYLHKELEPESNFDNFSKKVRRKSFVERVHQGGNDYRYDLKVGHPILA